MNTQLQSIIDSAVNASNWSESCAQYDRAIVVARSLIAAGGTELHGTLLELKTARDQAFRNIYR